jgi:hypothetical protein
MSTPVDPTITQTVSLASVDELVTQARRLGLTWGLRPGLVVDTTAAGGPYNPRVQLDGDDESTTIIAASLAGGLAVGMRVMVMFVPPAGNYVVGIISSTSVQRYEEGGFTNHATTITTTETVLETFSRFNLMSGAAYRVEIDGWLLAGAGLFTFFRLRETNAAGQVLTASDAFVGQGLVQASMRHVGYFINNTGTQVTDLVLTGQTLSSTSTWGADTGRPRYVSIQYAGPAVEYPFAVAFV